MAHTIFALLTIHVLPFILVVETSTTVSRSAEHPNLVRGLLLSADPQHRSSYVESLPSLGTTPDPVHKQEATHLKG